MKLIYLATSRHSKNSIVAIFGLPTMLQLIDQIQTGQRKDDAKECSHAGNANSAVDHVMLVTDADDHSFFSDGTYVGGFRVKFLQNTVVELTDLLVGIKRGDLHEYSGLISNLVPLNDTAMYVKKYLRKCSMNSLDDVSTCQQ